MTLSERLAAAANGDHSWRGQLIREAAETIRWCESQALNIMAVTADSGDEEANRLASDIAINLSLHAQGIVTATADETGTGSVERSEIEPGGEAMRPNSPPKEPTQ